MRALPLEQLSFDAGIRLSEFVERDMVSLRLTGPLRFSSSVLVGPLLLKVTARTLVR